MASLAIFVYKDDVTGKVVYYNNFFFYFLIHKLFETTIILYLKKYHVLFNWLLLFSQI